MIQVRCARERPGQMSGPNIKGSSPFQECLSNLKANSKGLRRHQIWKASEAVGDRGNTKSKSLPTGRFAQHPWQSLKDSKGYIQELSSQDFKPPLPFSVRIQMKHDCLSCGGHCYEGKHPLKSSVISIIFQVNHRLIR